MTPVAVNPPPGQGLVTLARGELSGKQGSERGGTLSPSAPAWPLELGSEVHPRQIMWVVTGTPAGLRKTGGAWVASPRGTAVSPCHSDSGPVSPILQDAQGKPEALISV